jgi:hypothetical protein
VPWYSGIVTAMVVIAMRLIHMSWHMAYRTSEGALHSLHHVSLERTAVWAITMISHGPQMRDVMRETYSILFSIELSLGI